MDLKATLNLIKESGSTLIENYCSSVSAEFVEQTIANLESALNGLLLQLNKAMKCLVNVLELFQKYNDLETDFALWLGSMETKVSSMLLSVVSLEEKDLEVFSAICLPQVS